ncbi:RagB/SusD family nutrient uptake outer membrane protein [Flavisolibacter nicotianae]|uniref:RagB/SusD family nutrient uptake outer membrane protein n=1 Tax=Flavisolibacter nicotianae TaxID=2364882 RepID=UPI000EB52B23|nr:RagB/SusD family nutrient uptake outer membrane protein [Flavisolibacter nicotianae]
MKKIVNYIFSALVGSLFLASCTKEIDQSPTYTLNGEERFKTINDYEYALTGAYSQFLANSYYGSTSGANAFVALPDMMSDNLYETSESLVNYTQFSGWYYTADDGYVEDIWLDAYSVVRQANLTLRGIDNLASQNPRAVNRIKAQALAIRALSHFDLLRYFGEDYGRNSTKLGVPYVDRFDIEQKPARLTVKATWDRIEADLKEAKNLMGNMDKEIQSATSTAASARSLIDPMVVNAILARMYNYAGVQDSAIKYATLVINARPLATPSEYPQIWKDVTTKEVVWSVKFQAFNSDIGGNVYYAVGNRASYRPTTNLLATYNASTDVRYPSFFSSIARRGTNRLVASKYIGKEGRTDGIVDFKAFRTSEMYLIRAEAYARLGNDVQALLDLNTLRQARNAASGLETGAALLDAIFVERRKELFMEGQRFFDLKRTTRTINRTTNCSNFCTLEPAAREWNLPIPQSEIQANPAIVQNPGY